MHGHTCHYQISSESSHVRMQCARLHDHHAVGGHSFCAKCILTWRCKACNADVVKVDECPINDLCTACAAHPAALPSVRIRCQLLGIDHRHTMHVPPLMQPAAHALIARLDQLWQARQVTDAAALDRAWDMLRDYIRSPVACTELTSGSGEVLRIPLLQTVGQDVHFAMEDALTPNLCKKQFVALPHPAHDTKERLDAFTVLFHRENLDFIYPCLEDDTTVLDYAISLPRTFGLDSAGSVGNESVQKSLASLLRISDLPDLWPLDRFSRCTPDAHQHDLGVRRTMCQFFLDFLWHQMASRGSKIRKLLPNMSSCVVMPLPSGCHSMSGIHLASLRTISDIHDMLRSDFRHNNRKQQPTCTDWLSPLLCGTRGHT